MAAALAVRTPTAAVAQSRAAESPSLFGSIAGPPDGKPVEGVAVSARAAASTMTTTVFSDEKGEYVFPSLPKGQYRVWAQAVGYKAARAEAAVDAKPQSLSFKLETLADFTPQLSGSEWLASLPDPNKEQRRMKEIFRVNCTLCHSAALTLQSRFDEPGWLAVIDMMARTSLASRSSVSGARDAYSTLRFHRTELAKYLAGVRGPDSPPLKFKLNPRPKGEAARVVFTEYDIPVADRTDGLAWFNGSDWSEGVAVGGDRGNPIHDIVIDNDGFGWITAHGTAAAWGTLTRLDPKTGHVTGLRLKREDGRVMGTHSLQRDENGIIWFASSPGLGRLDPKTQEIKIFYPPVNMGNGRGAGDIPDVDSHGKVWVNTEYGALRFDPDTKKWMYLRNLTIGAGFTYAGAGDADGNGWWTEHNMERVGKGDPKTGKSVEVVMRPPWLAKEEEVSTPADREFYETMGALTWGNISFVPGAQGPRRMAADKRGNWVWIANFLGNNLARIDTRTLETKYYRAPTLGTPYPVDVDKDHNAWAGLSGDDTLGKVNPQTGEWTIYQLPSHGCQPRDVRVDNIRGEVWAACRETARVERMQFRTAQQVQALKEQAGAATPR